MWSAGRPPHTSPPSSVVAQSATPVLCMLTPRNELTEAQQAVFDAVNAWIPTHGAAYVDFFTPMEDPVGSSQSTYLTDVVHPNATGEAIMAAAIDIAALGLNPATSDERPAMLSNWYVNGALQHWRGAVAPGAIDDHEGGYYDPATKVWATVTRVNAATIYDPATGRIHDVRAGYIPQNPWSSYYTGGKGYAPFPEELRSNVCAYSYFTSQADVDQWSMTASGTATIGTSGIYMKSLGATLVADASGNRAFWRTITSTAATRPLSVFIRASAAPTSADCQLCAVVGSGDPVGTLLTTTFTDLGGGVYRAKATYTGTAATWAIGLAVKADKTVFVDAFQDETGGAHHTSYIPTVASTATRNGVSITGPTTGFTAAGMTFMAVLGTPTAGITAEVMTWEAQTGTDFGLMCRVYSTPEGLRGSPTTEQLVAALAGTATG